MEEKRNKIHIVAEETAAVSSPDYYNPIGATQDNHSNENYLSELERAVGKKSFSYLDLACAGGQTVVDVYEMGNVACGVEGSDLNKMLNSTRWGPTYIGGTEKKSGAENWRKYKDVCLFKADITKSFDLLDANDEIVVFDIITAWDFLEHPLPNEIPFVLDNVVSHMHAESLFVALVNTVHGTHHRCVQNKEWWLKEFEKVGLVDLGFDFKSSPRVKTNPLSESDIGFQLRLAK